MLVSLMMASCGPAPTAPAPEVVEKTVIQTQIVEVTPMPGPHPERVVHPEHDCPLQ
jgi:hypothetical protein